MPRTEKRIAPAAFVKGLDQGSDPKLVADGLLVAKDAVFTRAGAICTRPGTAAVTGSYSSEDRLTSYADRPVLFGDSALKVLDGASFLGSTKDALTGRGDWSIGFVDAEGTSRTPSELTAQDPTRYTSVVFGSIRVVAYTMTNSFGNLQVVVASYRLDTGALVQRAVYTSVPTTLVRLVSHEPTGQPACAVWCYVNTSKELKWGNVDAAGAITQNADFAAAIVCNYGVPDLISMAPSRDVLVIASSNLGPNRVQLLKVSRSALIASYDLASTVTDQVYAHRWDADTVVATWDNGTNLMGIGVELDNMSATLTDGAGGAFVCGSLGAGIAAKQVLAKTSATVGELWWNRYTGASDELTLYKATLTNVAGTVTGTGSAPVLYHTEIGSRPMVPASGPYYLVIYCGANRLGLVMRSDGVFVGRWSNDLVNYNINGSLLGYEKIWLPWVSGTAGAWKCSSWDLTRGCWDLAISTPVDRSRCVEVDGFLYIPGGIGWEFDGQSLVEHGFLGYATLKGTDNATASSLEAKAYRWVVVPCWKDRVGNIQRGRPSDELSISFGAANRSGYIEWHGIAHTRKPDLFWEVYRTTGNGSTPKLRGTVANSANSCSILDGAADSTLGEPLYTEGGVLENAPPPPYRRAVLHQGRLFSVDRSAEWTRLGYSKPLRTKAPVEPADFLEVIVPADGGRITALESHLDRLVIFKAGRIYVCNGSGKDSTGFGAGYSEPGLLSVAAGCSNERSLVRFPYRGGLALAFLSSDGRIYALDSSWALQPIGERVRRLTQSLTITAACLLESLGVAVWFTSAGETLVYSYLADQWCTWTRQEAYDAITSGGVLYHKSSGLGSDFSSSYVRKLVPGTFGDSALHGVSLKLRTGWYSFDALLEFRRLKKILVLGQNISRHTLTVRIAYDFAPAWVDTQTFDSGSVVFDAESHYGAGLTLATYGDKAYTLSVATSRQRITSLMVELEVTPIIGEEGASFTGLAFVWSPKIGGARLPKAQEV